MNYSKTSVCVCVCVLYHDPRCCDPACRPLRPSWCLPTPRWAGRSGSRSPWSRSGLVPLSGSWCRATCRTAPGDLPPSWGSPWSAPMPWRLADAEEEEKEDRKKQEEEEGWGWSRTSKCGCADLSWAELGYLPGDAEVTAASTTCSFAAVVLHWSKAVDCHQACSASSNTQRGPFPWFQSQSSHQTAPRGTPSTLCLDS